MPLPRTRALVLVIVAAAMPQLVGAQATITGRVTTETGTGLSDVTVSLPALRVGARTDDSGHYSFTVPAANVTGQVAAIVARRVGYAPASAQITLTAGAMTRDFTMTQSALQLGQVIVTGAGTSQTRARIGSTINTVDSSVILRAATPQNIVTALTATAPSDVLSENDIVATVASPTHAGPRGALCPASWAAAPAAANTQATNALVPTRRTSHLVLG